MVVCTFFVIAFLWDWNENCPVATAECSKYAGTLPEQINRDPGLRRSRDQQKMRTGMPEQGDIQTNQSEAHSTFKM